jgi:hypothetical protein
MCFTWGRRRGSRQPTAQTLTGHGASAVILVLAGVALWADAGWWRPTAIAGLGVSTALLPIYFSRWYLFILAVNIALIISIGWMDWPAKATVGA